MPNHVEGAGRLCRPGGARTACRYERPYGLFSSTIKRLKRNRQKGIRNFIRHGAEDAVAEGLGESAEGLIVEGSAGKGPWAAVPWISVFDPAITTSATEGYYVVYLFHVGELIVHL
ncbi:MAG: DUF3578 domain-containing protein, partial [Pseudolabrys sp.]